MFWKLAEKFSEKNWSVLQNYWKMFYKIAWWEVHTLTQIEQPPCKNSGTPVTYWPFFMRPKDNKELLKEKSFTNFWYSLKHGKGDNGSRRSYTLWITRNNMNYHYMVNKWPLYWVTPSPLLCHFSWPFLVTPFPSPRWRHFSVTP